MRADGAREREGASGRTCPRIIFLSYRQARTKETAIVITTTLLTPLGGSNYGRTSPESSRDSPSQEGGRKNTDSDHISITRAITQPLCD